MNTASRRQAITVMLVTLAATAACDLGPESVVPVDAWVINADLGRPRAPAPPADPPPTPAPAPPTPPCTSPPEPKPTPSAPPPPVIGAPCTRNSDCGGAAYYCKKKGCAVSTVGACALRPRLDAQPYLCTEDAPVCACDGNAYSCEAAAAVMGFNFDPTYAACLGQACADLIVRYDKLVAAARACSAATDVSDPCIDGAGSSRMCGCYVSVRTSAKPQLDAIDAQWQALNCAAYPWPSAFCRHTVCAPRTFAIATCGSDGMCP